MTMFMECFGLSDRGNVRSRNEDHFLVAELANSMKVLATNLEEDNHSRLFGASQGTLLLVADGMGGQVAGDEASKIAVDAVITYVLNTVPWCFRLHHAAEQDFLNDLASALERSHESIRAKVHSAPDFEGMGTTLTMAYVLWPRLYVVHVGDSRCYLLRGGTLGQLTTDHTMAQQLVNQGLMTQDEVKSSRFSHMLWNALGARSPRPAPEAYKSALQPGDTLLLCTDGLTKHLDDAQIAENVGHGRGAEAACRALIDAANAAGGTDNITVVMARFPEVESDNLDTEELPPSS